MNRYKSKNTTRYYVYLHVILRCVIYCYISFMKHDRNYFKNPVLSFMLFSIINVAKRLILYFWPILYKTIHYVIIYHRHDNSEKLYWFIISYFKFTAMILGPNLIFFLFVRDKIYLRNYLLCVLNRYIYIYR